MMLCSLKIKETSITLELQSPEGGALAHLSPGAACRARRRKIKIISTGEDIDQVGISISAFKKKKEDPSLTR